MASDDPNDVMKMLAQLAQLTEQLEQLQSTAGMEEQAVPGDAAGLSLVERPSPTIEDMLIGLTERMEQLASQTEERGRRTEARLERIEKLLEEAKRGG